MLSPAAPLPIWPEVPRPQAQTVPSAFSAREKFCPLATMGAATVSFSLTVTAIWPIYRPLLSWTEMVVRP